MARKALFSKPNFRFLDAHSHPSISDTSSTFELDESDVWNSHHLPPPEPRSDPSIKKPVPSCRSSRPPDAASSLPLNIPDWSKILGAEIGRRRQPCSPDGGWDDGTASASAAGGLIPPHELVAKKRVASLSVHEGIGRTLKGRDLSRVRNAIWEKTGFQD